MNWDKIESIRKVVCVSVYNGNGYNEFGGLTRKLLAITVGKIYKPLRIDKFNNIYRILIRNDFGDILYYNFKNFIVPNEIICEIVGIE